MERKNYGDWVKKYTVMEMVGKHKRGKPKSTWNKVVEKDMKI